MRCCDDPQARAAGSSGAGACGPGVLVDAGLLALERVLERDEEVVAVRGGVGRELAVDLAGDDELDQRLAEGLHLEEGALGDRVGDLVRAVLADQVGDARVRDASPRPRRRGRRRRAAAAAG